MRAVRAMFNLIAPRYDLVNRIMTLGMDVGWRKGTIEALRLPPGSLVLDVACGTGDFCRELRKSRYRAIGFDMSEGMLARAKTKAALVLADALRLPVRDGAADGITCGFALRNVEDLGKLFREFARVVRSGGRIGLLEVSEPEGRLAAAGHRFYFRQVVPLIGGVLSDRGAYRYLPSSTSYLPSRSELLEMLGSFGFRSIERKPLAMGAAQRIIATRL